MPLGLPVETAKPLLRPRQLNALHGEEKRLESVLSAPPHIAGTVNRGEMTRQLKRIKTEREAQTPTAYREHELDDAHRREVELRQFWLEGMPTQAEMRRNPAGAVDKHRRWERAKKAAIIEWKNIQLRLHASSTGVDGHLDDERDVANIERFRPAEAGHELNMHNEQIPGKSFFMPERVVPAAVATDDELALLKELDPDTHAAMALLSSEQRARVLAVLRQQAEGTLPPRPPIPPRAPKPGKRTMNLSDEQRAARSENMKQILERQRLAKEAAGSAA